MSYDSEKQKHEVFLFFSFLTFPPFLNARFPVAISLIFMYLILFSIGPTFCQRSQKATLPLSYYFLSAQFGKLAFPMFSYFCFCFPPPNFYCHKFTDNVPCKSILHRGCFTFTVE